MNTMVQKAVRLGLIVAVWMTAGTAIAQTKWSVGTGNWGTGGTWNGGTIPGAGDTVLISDGHTVTFNVAGGVTVAGLTVGDGAGAACTLRIGRTSGTLDLSLTVTGDVTVGANGTLRHTNLVDGQLHTLTIGGSLANNSPTVPAGFDMRGNNDNRRIELVFDGGTNATITGPATATWDLFHVTFNKTSQAITVTNTAFSNFWAGSNLNRIVTYTSGTYVHNTAVAGNMQMLNPAIPPTTDNNIVFVEAAAGITVMAGTLNAMTADENIVFRGKLRVQGGTLNVGGSVDDALGYAGTTGVYEFVGGNVIVTGRVVPYDGTSGVSWLHDGGTLTVGTIDTGTNTNMIAIAQGSTLNWVSGSMILQQAAPTGTQAHVAFQPTAATINGGTLQIGDGSTTPGQTFTISSAVEIPNLTISNAGGTAKTLQVEKTRLRVLGTLDIQSGTTLAANSLEIFVDGAWTNNGTFTAGSADTSVVGFRGTTTISGSGTHQFHHVAVPGTVTLPATTLATGNLSATGTINGGTGTFEMNGGAAAIRREYVNTSTGPAVMIPDNDPAGANSNIVVAGQGTISKVKVVVTILHLWEDDLRVRLRHPDGTLVNLAMNRGNNTDNAPTYYPNHFQRTMFDDAAATPIASGSPPYEGTFIPDGALSALNTKSANGTWQLFVEDTVNQDVGVIIAWSLYLTVDTAGSIGLNHLTVNSSATKTAEWGLDVNGNFTLSAGTFAPGTYTHTVAGNWNDSGGTFTPTAGTINFDGAGAQSITAGGSNNFFGVTMSNGGARTPATALNIDGAFTLSGGSFSPGAFTHTVAGNWNDSGSSGGFTPGAGTIQFDAASGTQTVAVHANNNFFNVTKTGGTATRQQTGGVVDVNGAFLLSAGTWDANSIGMEVAGNFTNNATFTPGTQTVTLDGAAQSILGSSSTTFSSLTAAGSSTKTLNPGAGVETYVSATLTVSSTLALADSKILHLGTGAASGTANVTGTLQTTSGSSNKPTITSFSAVSPRHDFNVTGTLDLDGLIFEYANASGMDVQPGGTILQLDNVAFQNIAAGGRHLGVNVAALTRNCFGCTFTAVGGGNNVVAVDTGAGDDLRLNFEFRSAAEHGAGAGESFDSDDDPDEDGLSAAGGAVVTWIYAIGTPQGVVQGAIDLSTFTWYATYAVVSGANGLSYVMVLDASGVVQYAYSFSETTYGSAVGPLWWDNDGGGANKRVYFGTTGGFLFRLNDSGAALAPAVGFPIDMRAPAWTDPPDCDVVTSPCTADATRIYFGGLSGGTPYIYAIPIGGGGSWAWGTLPSPSGAMRSLMGFAFDWGAGTYIFAASDGGVVYKITATSGVVAVFNGGGGIMRAPVTIGGFSIATQHLVEGDYSGNLHMIDADSSSFLDYAGTWPFPLTGGGQVRGAALFDSSTEMSYVGDSNGRVHKVMETGAYAASYPVLMSDPSAIETSPLFEGSYLYVGNTNGKVYVITEATGVVFTTLNYGAGLTVNGFAWADMGGPRIMFTLSNGKTYYLVPF